jgi:hypothetical protein
VRQGDRDPRRRDAGCAPLRSRAVGRSVPFVERAAHIAVRVLLAVGGAIRGWW